MVAKVLTTVIAGLLSVSVPLISGCTPPNTTGETQVTKELKGTITKISNVNGRTIAEVVDESGKTFTVDVTENGAFNTKFLPAVGAYCMSPAGYLPCSFVVGLAVSIVYDGGKWVVSRIWR